MSDSELSDGMEELQQLIAEYEAKAKEKDPEDNNNISQENLGETTKTDKHESKISNEGIEVPMDKILFGDKKTLIANFSKSVGDYSATQESDDDNDVEKDDQSITQSKTRGKKRKPVWADADDEEIQVGEVKRETKYTGPLDHLRKDKSYKEYLTARFTRIVAQPKWAQLDRKPVDGTSDDEELLRTVGFLAKPSEYILQPNHLTYKRLKDLNRETYAEGGIKSVQFHPTSTAALVAGNKGIATIYSIDGQRNEKLHSIHFKNFPIKRARIYPCGKQAIFGSVKNYYYMYDLIAAQETRLLLPKNIHALPNFELSPCGRYIAIAGRFGSLHLLDAKSNELLHSFKQEDDVAAMCFTSNSKQLICSSFGSKINIYSLRAQRMEHSFFDDGCIRGHAIDLAPNQRLLATGSLEGVVNVYDFEGVQKSETPQPEKIFLNLTTGISEVKFNHSSELLSMCSRYVPSGVKIAHFPSGTVYSNFPGFKSDIGLIQTMEFSPGSGYLAMGNRSKEVRLFRLPYYKNY